jgi:hypothetical protein
MILLSCYRFDCVFLDNTRQPQKQGAKALGGSQKIFPTMLPIQLCHEGITIYSPPWLKDLGEVMILFQMNNFHRHI